MVTPRSLCRWQSRLRCTWFDHHCTHPITEGWCIDMWAVLDTYSHPEVMARHSAPRPSLLERIKTWIRRLWR